MNLSKCFFAALMLSCVREVGTLAFPSCAIITMIYVSAVKASMKALYLLIVDLVIERCMGYYQYDGVVQR